MSKVISFSMPDYLINELEEYREKRGIKNKSEWFQEIVSKGLEKIKKEATILGRIKGTLYNLARRFSFLRWFV